MMGGVTAVRRLGHRLAVSVFAGFASVVGALAVYRLVRPAAFPLHAADLRDAVAYAGTGGAVVGAGYAVLRPLLPRRPEIAGLMYAFASHVLLRAFSTAVARSIGRSPRRYTTGRALEPICTGLSLATAEHLLGPAR
jgi:hypothetical protein